MSQTQQPEWKRVGSVRDVNPVDYGGGYVYVDTTGVYPPELEIIEPPCDDADPGARWTIYRVPLDGCKWVDDEPDESGAVTRYLVGDHYQPTHRYPAHDYQEWFVEYLDSVAAFVGRARSEIEADLCSGDPMRLAHAYEDIAAYFGWCEFDQYPLSLTREEVETRYVD